MQSTRFGMLAMVAVLTGCDVVTSSHPVGNDVPTIDVGEWNGRWSFTDDSERIFDVEVIDRDAGVLEISTYPPDPSSPPLSSYLRGSENDQFINLPRDGTTEEYLWLRIANDGNAILLWSPDASKLRRLVDSGALPGRCEKGTVQLFELSSEQTELIVSDNEGVLFDWKSPWVLRRVSQ